MIIRNHTARAIGTKIGEKKVALIPGANEVSTEVWEAMRGIKVVQTMLKNGDLSEPTSKAEQAEEVDFAALKPADAIKLVKDTLDVDRLEAWYVEEKRKKVSDAIEAQLEKVKIKPKPDGDEGAEGDEEEENPDEK